MDNKRYRNFSLISYLCEEDILDVISSNSNIKHYAFILHDKDVKKDGSAIVPHYHILLRLYNACTSSAVCKAFKHGFSENTFCESTLSDNIFSYLTHIGFEDKFQYDEKDIVADDLDFWRNLYIDKDSDNNALNILEDLHAGVDLITMARRYGRDFIINYEKYLNYYLLSYTKKQD